MPTVSLDKLRAAILPRLPVYVFLIAYLTLTVLGDVLYSTPLGAAVLSLTVKNFSWGKFGPPFDAGFWLLMVLPLLLCPLAFLTGRLASPVATIAAKIVPELSRPIYLLLTGALYFYAIKSLSDADALGKFLSGTDRFDAVRDRFQLISELGQKPQIVLKSLLVFLSVYAGTRASRERGWFWPAATAVNAILLTVCLTLLNMKWPAVVFILTLATCVFAFSEKHQYAKALSVVGFGIAFYLVLAVVVMRLFPNPEFSESLIDSTPSEQEAKSEKDKKLIAQSSITADNLTELVGNTASGVFRFAPRLLAAAINRMALAPPFYYDMHNFTGPACQPSLSRLWHKRDMKCEPTLLVYSKIYGDYGFAGIGTAPAASNIYGYARAGWPGAIISTVFVMIVLGLFLALWRPAQCHAVFAAAFVMGCYTAYFFSQLPIEGPVVYDHGMIWWTLIVLAWTAGYTVYKWPHL